MDNSFIGNMTLEKLINASKRGVNVYLLIDGLNFKIDQKLKEKLRMCGGTVVRLNRFSNLFKYVFQKFFSKTFNRHHQKVSIIDNTTFIGSGNIGKSYSGFNFGNYEFRDVNLMIEGAYSHRLNNYINRILEDHGQEPVDFERYIKKSPTKPIYIEDEKRVEYCFNIQGEKNEIQDKLIDLYSEAKQSIILIQPYFQKIPKINDVLKDAAQRGVKVEILTAKKRDQPCYRLFRNNNLFKDLLLNGVEVYEEPYKFLHTKAIVIDNKILTLGSWNNDNFSKKVNNEANMFYYAEKDNDPVIQNFLKIYEDLKKQSRLVEVNKKEALITRIIYKIQIAFWDKFFLKNSYKLMKNEISKLPRESPNIPNAFFYFSD